MRVNITARQAQVLAFIIKHQATEQANPSLWTICDHFGWSSVNAAAEHLRALENKGVIERRPKGNYIITKAYDR